MIYLIYTALYLFIFIIGACIGSFVNVIIYRLPKKISISKGRSFCPACGHTLSPLDLVPIVSWLCLKGKCRYCGGKISPRYALGEAVLGASAVAGVAVFWFSWHTAVVFAATAILYCVAMIDLDTLEIPNGLIIALAVPAAAALFTAPEADLLSRAIGFFEISVPMLLITLIKKGGFGGGDIKLCAVAGFLLGWKLMLVGTFFALLTGGGYAIYCLIKKTKTKGDRFAFGPFLSLGLAIAMYFGNYILSAYLSIFIA